MRTEEKVEKSLDEAGVYVVFWGERGIRLCSNIESSINSRARMGGGMRDRAAMSAVENGVGVSPNETEGFGAKMLNCVTKTVGLYARRKASIKTDMRHIVPRLDIYP